MPNEVKPEESQESPSNQFANAEQAVATYYNGVKNDTRDSKFLALLDQVTADSLQTTARTAEVIAELQPTKEAIDANKKAQDALREHQARILSRSRLPIYVQEVGTINGFRQKLAKGYMESKRFGEASPETAANRVLNETVARIKQPAPPNASQSIK